MPRSTTSRVFLDANVIFSGVYSPRGTPGRLLQHATSGDFRAVICSTVLAEVLRNLDLKVGRPLPGMSTLVLADTFEIMPDPLAPEVDVWAARGFGTDSTIVAAALTSEVEYLCTGDRKLIRELPQFDISFEVISPRTLLTVIEGKGFRA